MATGLSDNNATSMVVDSSGYLWVGTTDGLNQYNGYGIKTYYAATVPALPHSHIERLYCDTKNRIWAVTRGGVCLIDEHRKFNLISLPTVDSSLTNGATYLTGTPQAGILYFSGKTCFRLPPAADALNPKNWQVLDWCKQFTNAQVIRDVCNYKNDLLVITTSKKIYVTNIATQQIVAALDQVNPRSACMVSDSILAKMDFKGLIETYNIYTKKTTYSYYLKSLVNGKQILNNLYRVRLSVNNNLVVTSSAGGLFMINLATNIISIEAHDAGNKYSISYDDTRQLYCLPDGTVIVSSPTQGVNITNLNQQLATTKSIFADANKNVYDGPINGLITDEANSFWLATDINLLHWNKASNKTDFITYPNKDSATGQPKATTIKALAIDSMHRLWVSGYDVGIAYLDKKKQVLTALKYYKARSSAESSDYIHDFLVRPSGIMWACSGRGIFAINTQTLQLQSFLNHPVLKKLKGIRTFDLLADGKSKVWMATESNGIFCYNESAQTLQQYTITSGLASNNCVAICQDNSGNIYAAQDKGLSIIQPNGTIKIINTKNGLRSDKCQALLKDAAGDIWISNQRHLIKYHPADSSCIYYDNKAGLTNESFKNNATCIGADGILYWGTANGINYFLPGQLNPNPPPLKLSIASIALPDTSFDALQTRAFFFEPYQNNLSIFFNAIDLFGSQNILYQYKLDGADKQWNSSTDIGQVNYPALPSGKYTFWLKASKDGVTWTATQPLTITIATPWYRSWWFMALCGGFLVSTVFIIVKKREKNITEVAAQKAREQKLESENLQYQLQLEQALTATQLKEIEIATLGQNLAQAQLTATRAQMNPHFIFNALNSVQQYILQGNVDEANKYLAKFSRLQREILNHCDQQFISLQKEIDMIRLYVEFEQLRLNDSFHFAITTYDNIDTDELMVPPMVLQPFVENAIWHGLQPKAGERQLSISFAMAAGDENLLCTITDNGIGRKAAMQHKVTSQRQAHISKGLHLVNERLELLQQQYGGTFKATITDLYLANQNPAGTRVEVLFFMV